MAIKIKPRLSEPPSPEGVQALALAQRLIEARATDNMNDRLHLLQELSIYVGIRLTDIATEFDDRRVVFRATLVLYTDENQTPHYRSVRWHAKSGEVGVPSFCSAAPAGSHGLRGAVGVFGRNEGRMHPRHGNGDSLLGRPFVSSCPSPQRISHAHDEHRPFMPNFIGRSTLPRPYGRTRPYLRREKPSQHPQPCE